jgi:hypothetical protein
MERTPGCSGMTNPAKPSALFAGTAEPDQGRCNGSLGGSGQAERCSGVFRRLRKPRKPWSGWSGNRWDTERKLSVSTNVESKCLLVSGMECSEHSRTRLAQSNSYLRKANEVLYPIGFSFFKK